MAPAVQILPVSDASDGVGSGPVASKNAYRDDHFYMERIAERWAKHRHMPPGVKYRLDRLPNGFAGYASQRENEPKHIDRYLYGHPNGHFRSMNELWPHFIHLQEQGSPVGCQCKLCTGRKPTKTKSNSGNRAGSASNSNNSVLSSSPGEQSRFFAPTAVQKASEPQNPPSRQRPSDGLMQGRLPPVSPSTQRRKHMDDEGTPDIYPSLIAELREVGTLDKDITEQMSPDWRAGHEMLQRTFDEWSTLHSFVPRVGELVLFARNVVEEGIAWDTATQSLRRVDEASKAWLDRIMWEAGVVTQMPLESISAHDLTGIPPGKKAVTYSGFRIEPLSEPGSQNKSLTKQHKYVPLHAVRPFWLWKDLCGPDGSQWHATLKHALTVSSSFCVVGRYSFKGHWPEATVFARGVYIGTELLMIGDTVRLLPPTAETKAVSDVLVITSIRLRFVKLDDAVDDDFQSCLHITGKAYTLDPKKSFGGIARAPVNPGTKDLPEGLAGYGRWFSMLDPAKPKDRLELPFSRILGRYVEHEAIKTWSQTPSEMPPPSSSFQAVNTSSSSNKIKIGDISQGLPAIRESREYSIQHDNRIDRAAGKTWFWAETRIEQLDLHEVNGRFVGVKDESRKKHMPAWRQALKLLDGKKGGSEQYQAARKQRQDEMRDGAQAPPKAFGMMATGLQHSTTEAENSEGEGDEEEDDGDVEEMKIRMSNDTKRAGFSGVIDLSMDDDGDKDIMVLD